MTLPLYGMIQNTNILRNPVVSLKKKKMAFANEAINIDVFLRSPRALSFLQLAD